jgi:perosamine synthetase
LIPYSRHDISDDDIDAVISALKSDFLTTGPRVGEFESEFAGFVGARFAVSVCSGTAGLHAAIVCSGVGPGDEVIVPTMTFAATANAVVHSGATPVFADVEPDTLLVDPVGIEVSITPRTKMIVAVDYAGQPCRYDEIRELAKEHNLILLSDSCHSLGASYRGRPVGSIADLTVFSFHPVKPITTAEGGMVTTDNSAIVERIKRFRNHGINRDSRQRQIEHSWEYDIEELGFNYRLSDIQCALGISQLSKCRSGMQRRNQIARRYRAVLEKIPGIDPLALRADVQHAYHLFVVRVDFQRLNLSREDLFRQLHERGVRINVHYGPVHLLRYYRDHLGTRPGQCPAAEAAHRQVISLPVYASLTDGQVDEVLGHLGQLVSSRTAGSQNSPNPREIEIDSDSARRSQIPPWKRPQ